MVLGTRFLGYFVKLIFLLLASCLLLGAKTQEISHQEGPIRIGFSSSIFIGVEKRDVEMALAVWSQEIVKMADVGGLFTAIFFDDLSEVVKAAQQRQVECVAMSFFDYMKIRHEVDLEPALIGTQGGKMGEEYALIVHQSSPWTDVKHLRGAKLLVQASFGAGAISLLWLDTLLLEAKLPVAAKTFRVLKRVDQASQAILPVFFKQADACLVPRWAFDTMAELNPQVKQEMRIVASSPSFVRGACFVLKNLSVQKRDLIHRIMNIGHSPRAKQLLTLFHTEEMVVFQPAHLEPTLTLFEKYQALIKKRL